MKTIVTNNFRIKQCKMDSFEKKKTERYWQLVYGPDYAEEMVAEVNTKPQTTPRK
jgi:hypothetical protein